MIVAATVTQKPRDYGYDVCVCVFVFVCVLFVCAWVHLYIWCFFVSGLIVENDLLHFRLYADHRTVFQRSK